MSPSSLPAPVALSEASSALPDFDSDLRSGAEAIAQLQGSVKDICLNLDGIERRLDTRFEHVEEEIVQLVQRHEQLCRTLRGSQRAADLTSDTLNKMESNAADVREMLSELTRTIGTVFHQLKEHRREVQQTLSAEKESLRAVVQDILPKIGRMDLDIGILRSQRDVDRARMERLEMGMTVLEAADSTILNSVRRLERGVEDLSDSYSQLERGVEDHTYSKGDPTLMAISVPILTSYGHRTLADELMDTDWTDGITPEQSDTDVASLSDRDERSPFVPPTPVATPLQPSSCPPILPVPGQFVRAWLTNASDFARAARLHRFLYDTYKALPTPPRVLVALAILTCTCLLSVYALSSVADRFFVSIDNRPIWEKSRRL